MNIREVLLIILCSCVITVSYMLGTNALGIMASIIAFLLFVPQAMRAWDARNQPAAMSAVSIGTQVLLLTNAIVWALYGLGTHAFWVAAPGIVNGPLALVVMSLVIRSRREAHKIENEYSDVCSRCNFQGEHEIYITQPPGYGSRMPCSSQSVKNGYPVPATIPPTRK